MGESSQGVEQARRFASPQEEAFLTLMRAADCLHREMQHRLKPFGLTATQYNVLRILRGAASGAAARGLTCSAIGQRMITPEPDITRLLARLKSHKLVTQQRDSEDRRVVRTRITPQGMDILSSLDESVEQAPRELLKGLAQSEVLELIRLLTKMQSCGGKENAAQIEEAPLTGKPPSPHLSRSPLPPRLRHPLE